MSYSYWNPEDQPGKSFRDQMVYDQRYFNWTETPKYQNQAQYPHSSMGYPRYRNNLRLRRPVDIYYNKDLKASGAARLYKKFNYPDDTTLYYFRHILPPTYYEMYG